MGEYKGLTKVVNPITGNYRLKYIYEWMVENSFSRQEFRDIICTGTLSRRAVKEYRGGAQKLPQSMESDRTDIPASGKEISNRKKIRTGSARRTKGSGRRR